MSAVEEPPVTRVCPRCSAQNVGAGQFCPQCGTSYVKVSRRPTRRQSVVMAVVAALVLAGVGGIVAKRQHDASQREDVAAASKDLAADRAREADEAQAEADDAERTARDDLVTYLEDQITQDAKESVSDGVLDGPIKFTQCTATGGGSTDDLTALTGTFECLAANVEKDDGTIEGYAYSGTAEWETGSISWRFGR